MMERAGDLLSEPFGETVFPDMCAFRGVRGVWLVFGGDGAG